MMMRFQAPNPLPVLDRGPQAHKHQTCSFRKHAAVVHSVTMGGSWGPEEGGFKGPPCVIFASVCVYDHFQIKVCLLSKSILILLVETMSEPLLR